MHRRSVLGLLASASLGFASPPRFQSRIAGYLATHRRPDGGYGWSSELVGQLTPTFAVIGCYRALGLPIPQSSQVAAFVRSHYPIPENRRAEANRPLWRFDFEQAQALAWLGGSLDEFRGRALTWAVPPKPSTRYEIHGTPTLQHLAMAVHVRHLLGVSSLDPTGIWREYFLSRRRADGTFNNTPASDGTGGHIMNTWWGLQACSQLDVALSENSLLTDWVSACQKPSGGFTYSPKAQAGAVEDVAYTWSALQVLGHLSSDVPQPAHCADWILSLQTDEGGFQDRPGGEPNPMATFYALSCLQLLGMDLNKLDGRSRGVKRAPRVAAVRVPDGLRVFTMQIEAPGSGSPSEAVSLAKALGIDIWAAKNATSAWMDEVQRIAREQRAPVLFAIGNEEHGSYTGIPGLGFYSHLADMVAPCDRDTGMPVPEKNHPYTWRDFNEIRVRPLRKGGGRLVWQTNDNEELTRALLDDALESKAYAAIASFHFGKQNFTHTYPVLHRWYNRIPFVGLQDAHTKESWWWGDQLSGQRTLFLAKEPTWDEWLRALDNNWVMAVRHDEVTEWKTHLAGGPPAVRDVVMKQKDRWTWWDTQGRPSRRPAASLVCLKPGALFESGAPSGSTAERVLRLRLWCDNTQYGRPLKPNSELVEMRVDGKVVQPALFESEEDRYFHFTVRKSDGERRAEADVRLLRSGTIETVAVLWRD